MIKKKKNAPLKGLFTVWGENLNTECPLGDYPRPQMRRQGWQCLNGIWEYAISDSGREPAEFDGEILVPFSPETLLSGVGRQLLPGQTLWYKKSLRFEGGGEGGGEGERLLLHFGAVDQHCEVFCNGQRAGAHAGGYWPFYFDITGLLREGENDLLLRVTDDMDGGDEAYGKQRRERGNIWYTGQSGIWQSVWCEWVPESYIRQLRITPLYREARVSVALFTEGAPPAEGHVRVFDEDTLVAEGAISGGRAVLDMPPDFKSWSPDSPFLYTLEICSGEDKVDSYFGMREFGMERASDGRPRITLNGKPIFHNGLLDQGYWSDGMYTAPSDEAMVWELEQIKAMGFNMLRKHIKIEPLRWYYHCDRLGIIVWQDFVSGGGPYIDFVIRIAPWLGLNFRDGKGSFNIHGRKSEAGRQNFLRDARRTVDLLYNTVSLSVWVPFNEGWGQFDALGAERLVREFDSTRLIDHASGYFDRGGGDFYSRHVYFRRFRRLRDRRGRILALTEFGGYSLSTPGHMSSDELYGYKHVESSQALNAELQRLYEQDVFPALKKGMGALVYTQVSDVEDEINGLFTYDRRVTKPDLAFIRDLNKKVMEAFEKAL